MGALKGTLLGLVTLLGLLQAEGRYAMYGKRSKVTNLRATNFDKLVISDQAVWLVEFYAPWYRLITQPWH